jgi:hypothetical protein
VEALCGGLNAAGAGMIAGVAPLCTLLMGQHKEAVGLARQRHQNITGWHLLKQRGSANVLKGHFQLVRVSFALDAPIHMSGCHASLFSAYYG